jgi:hypothetical protein
VPKLHRVGLRITILPRSGIRWVSFRSRASRPGWTIEVCYNGANRRYRLTVRTEPSQGSNTGSIPVSATKSNKLKITAPRPNSNPVLGECIRERWRGGDTVRWGPHVVGWFDSEGRPIEKLQAPLRGKGGSVESGENQQQVFTASPTPLGISLKARDSHFPTATTTASVPKTKVKTKAAHAA